MIATSVPEPSFWCSLAAVCKFTNDIVTPLLYANIRFDKANVENAVKCCRILASSDRLASMVRSFHLGRLFIMRCSKAVRAEFHAHFIQSLARMSSLRHLGYETSFGFNAKAWHALVKSSAPLESLAVCIEEPANEEAAIQLTGMKLSFPQLTRLQITNRSLANPNVVKLWRHLLVAHSSRLRGRRPGPR